MVELVGIEATTSSLRSLSAQCSAISANETEHQQTPASQALTIQPIFLNDLQCAPTWIQRLRNMKPLSNIQWSIQSGCELRITKLLQRHPSACQITVHGIAVVAVSTLEKLGYHLVNSVPHQNACLKPELSANLLEGNSVI